MTRPGSYTAAATGGHSYDYGLIRMRGLGLLAHPALDHRLQSKSVAATGSHAYPPPRLRHRSPREWYCGGISAGAAGLPLISRNCQNGPYGRHHRSTNQKFPAAPESSIRSFHDLHLQDRTHTPFCPCRIISDIHVMIGSAIQVSEHERDRFASTIENVGPQPAVARSGTKRGAQLGCVTQAQSKQPPLICRLRDFLCIGDERRHASTVGEASGAQLASNMRQEFLAPMPKVESANQR